MRRGPGAPMGVGPPPQLSVPPCTVTCAFFCFGPTGCLCVLCLWCVCVFFILICCFLFLVVVVLAGPRHVSGQTDSRYYYYYADAFLAPPSTQLAGETHVCGLRTRLAGSAGAAGSRENCDFD